MTNRLTPEQIAVFSPRLAEMELAEKQMNRSGMAKELGISLHKINTIRNSDQYQELMQKLRISREKSVEKVLKFSTIAIREKLSDYTNEAVDTIYRLMTTAKLDTVKLAACCEILDRDGRFAKVSRLMNVQQGQDGAPMLPEDAAAEIMEAMKTAKLTVN